MLSLFNTWGLKAILFITSIFISLHSFSDVIIVSPPQENALKIANKIKENINSNSRIVHKLEKYNTSDIVLTLGEKALDSVIDNPDINIVSSFIDPSYFYTTKYRDTIKHKIYDDPSPLDIALFLKKNFKYYKIGVIYTQEESGTIANIKSHLKKTNIEITPIQYSGDIFKDIRNLRENSIDMLLLIKNRKIYKPENITLVLRSLLRKQIPVITTSKSLVNSGAAIAITPSENSIIQKTYNIINQMLANSSPENNHLYHYADTINIYTNKSTIGIYNLMIEEGKQ